MKPQHCSNRYQQAVNLSVVLSAMLSANVMAAPSNGRVSAGQGTISQPAPTVTQINQQSHSMVLDWNSFNVSANEQVNFIQPSSTASVLNNILDQNPSQIFGSINANGRVFLSNPNGLIFGPDSVVNVQSLIATGLKVDTDRFMAGNYNLQSLQNAGSVINYGLINAASGGNVALLGGHVANHGQIIAKYGHVALAGGRQMVLDFDGDGLINFQINEQLLSNSAGHENGVLNSGQITADGGQIVLQAQAAADVFTNVVNNEGMLQANSIENVGGVIRLQSSGRTLHSGDISVRSENAQAGQVQVLGDQVGLLGDATIDAGGSDGGGIVLIGSDYQGNNSAIQNASQTYVSANSKIQADAVATGDGGKVIVWADKTTGFYGNISAQGGSTAGSGGFAEVSGKQKLDFQGTVNLSSASGEAGTLLLDPSDIEIKIASNNSDLSSTTPFEDVTDNAGVSVLSVSTLTTALGTGDVIVSTNSPESDAGDITVSNNVSWTTNTLTLHAENDIIINADLTGTNADIFLTANAGASNNVGAISGSGTLTADALGLSAATGIDVNTKVTSLVANNTTSGDIIVNEADDIQLGTSALVNSNGGAVTLVSGGSITEPSAGTGDNITTSGAVSLTAATSIGSAVANGELDIKSSTDLTIDVNDSFYILGSNEKLSALSVTVDPAGAATYSLNGYSNEQTFTMTTDSSDLTLVDVSNTKAVPLSITADTGNINVTRFQTNNAPLTIVATNGDIALADNAINAGTGSAGNGNINLTSLTGDITVAATATADITTSGSLNLTAAAIGATNMLDIDKATSLNIQDTGAGDISINELTASINSTSVTVANATSGDIDITYSGGDMVNINSGHIFDTTTLDHDFSYTATVGDISDLGTLTLNGNAVFTANQAGASITLDSTGNHFGGNVLFVGSGGLSNVTIVDNSAFDLQALSLSGNLTVTSAGPITQSGIINANLFTTTSTGNTTLGMDNTITSYNGTTVTSGNIVLKDLAGLAITGITTAAGGNATITTTGLLTQSGIINANLLTTTSTGTTTLGMDNTLTSYNGTTVTSGNIVLKDLAGLALTGITTAGGGNATITTTGLLTQSGIINAGLLTTISTGNTTLGMDNTITSYNGTTLSNGNIVLKDTGGLAITGITTDGTGDTTITSTGVITQNTGVIDTDVLTTTSTGNTTLASANTITSYNGSTLTSGNIELNDLSGLELTGIAVAASGDATITTTGILTDAANTAIDVPGIGSFDAGGAAITLGDNAADATNFGSLTLTGGVITLSEDSDSVLNAVNASSLTLVSNGAISDSGSVTVAGDASFTSGVTNANINLDQLDVAGTIAINTQGATGDVSIVNTGTFGIAASSVGGSLQAVATGGDISIASIVAGGTVTLDAPLGSINDAADDLVADITAVGLITLTTRDEIGGVASPGVIDARQALEFAVASNVDLTSTQAGAIVITGLGALTLTDVDTADGAISVSAGGSIDAIDVMAGDTSNDLAHDLTLNATAGDINLQAVSAYDEAILDAAAGSILDSNGDLVNITAVNASLSASNNIGAISDFATQAGDAIEINLTGDFTKVNTTANNARINLAISGNNAFSASNALFDGTGGQAILTSGGSLDVANITLQGTESLALSSANILTLPGAGLTTTGDLQLSGVADIVDDGITDDANSRTLLLGAADLNFTSGSGGGSTILNSSVDTLSAALTGAADLVINENDAITLNNVDVFNGAVDLVAGGAVTASQIQSGDNNAISLSGVGIALGSINSGGAFSSITLDANNAAISANASPLTAGSLIIKNTSAAGASGSPINSVASSIDFMSGNSGPVYISNNSAAGLSVVGAASGEIAISEISGQLMTIPDGGAITSNGNPISLVADGLSLGAASTGSINAGVGDLLITTFNASQPISLGAGSGLLMTQQMLNQMGATGTFTIGDTSQTAGISIGGNIDIDLPANLNDQLDLVTGGSISTAVSGTITAAALSLTASDGIDVRTDSARLTAVVTSAGNISVLETDQLTLVDLAASNGSIDVLSSNGSLEAGTINAGNNTVTLSALNGSISKLGSDNITAGQLIAHAQSGIDLDTTGTLELLDVDTTNGPITIRNSGQLAVTDVQSAGGNSITLMTDSLLSVGSLDSGSGDLTVGTFSDAQLISLGAGSGLVLTQSMFDQMSSSGSLTIGQATQSAGIVIGGAIDIDAVTTLNAQLNLLTAGSITDSGNNPITVSTLNLNAGSGIGSAIDAIDSTAATASLQLAASGLINLSSATDLNLLDVSTLDGSITVNSAGVLNVRDVRSGNDNNINLTGNGIVVDRIDAGLGTVTLNSGTAGITQLNIVNNIDIAASQLIADSATGLDLDTAVSSVNISDIATGGIVLHNTGAVDLQDVDTTDGSISITSNAGLTATDVQTGNDGDITLSAVGLVIKRINAGAGTVTLDAQGGALISDLSPLLSAGLLNLKNSSGIGDVANPFNTAASAIDFSDNIHNDVYIDNASLSNVDVNGVTDGSIIFNESGGNLSIATGGLLSNDNLIQLTASNGDIIFNGPADAGSASMLVSASGQISGPGLISAASLDLVAASGIGSSGAELQTAAGQITLFNTTANGSFISNTAASGVTVKSNGANSGAVEISESLGAMTIDGINAAGDSAVFNAKGEITLANPVVAGDDITLISNASINGLALLDSSALSLSAQNGIGNINALTTTARLLDFSNVNNDVVISASLAEWNVSGNAGNGNINLTNHSGSLFLKSLETRADLNLNAPSGSIDDANAELLNLTANNVTLVSSSGIGADDALETSINNLNFTNNTGLAVQMINSGTSTLTLQQGSNTAAPVSLAQSTPGGMLLINGELISNDADISLSADNMDLSLALDPVTNLPVGKINAGSGTVSLSAFSSNQSIIIGGGSATFSDAVMNNINTSGGLTIGSAAHLAEVIIDGSIDTSQTVTGGGVSLLSDGNIAVGGSMINAVDTSLISGNGNILISGNLASQLNLTLQAVAGNIHFRDGFVLTSNTGNIILNTTGSIAGTGDGTFNAATGLLASTDLSMSGDILINVDLLNIEKNITSTAGSLTVQSANPVTINPGVLLSAAQTLNMPAFSANGDLTINGKNGVILSGENTVANSGKLDLNSTEGTLQLLFNLTASGDVNIIARDLLIDPAAAVLTIDGTLSIADPASGKGIGLGAFQPDKLNLDINEYNAILAAGIVLQSGNDITLGTNFSSDVSMVPLTINTASLVMTDSTRIALASDLDFSSSIIDVAGGLDIDVLGSFAMAGAMQTDGAVSVKSDTGITMAANSSISSNDSQIDFVTDTGDIRLGLLDAGGGKVKLTATEGDILNNHGVFLDVTQARTNVLAASLSMDAKDKIGVSSTDAITVNIDARSPITLKFGASTAYINNLFSSPIINLGSGTVAEGFVFSNQILGIGHNLGQNSTRQSSVSAVVGGSQQEKVDAVSILGIDLIALLADDEEDDDFISSIIPSVPVMIRTKSGWEFKSPSRQQLLERSNQRRQNGYKNIDWF